MIKIIGTGGTIANTPDGRIAAADVLEQLPQAREIADIRVEDTTRVASSALGYAEMIDTAQRVNRTFAEEPDVEGVVITIGSNQSEDMAYFLNLTVDDDRPVVVTAAQRKRNTLSEDASRNFLDALVVATSPDAAGRGVTLVANETIHPAREVTKNVVSRTDTWQSLDTGALGIVSGNRAVFYRSPVRRHTVDSEFRLAPGTKATDLPKVEILYCYADVDPGLIECAVERGARGLVMAAFATGAPHSGQEDVLRAAIEEHGVAVVIGNRGSSGRIDPDSIPYLGADNLTPQKALTLLKLALTVTDDTSKLQRFFDEY